MDRMCHEGIVKLQTNVCYRCSEFQKDCTWDAVVAVVTGASWGGWSFFILQNVKRGFDLSSTQAEQGTGHILACQTQAEEAVA